MAPRQRQVGKKHPQRGGASKLSRPLNGEGSNAAPQTHLRGPSPPWPLFPRVNVCAYGAVLALALLCYANTLGHGLVHDDVFAVESNQDVRGDAPLRNLLLDDFWGKPMGDNTSHKSYRPLCVLTFRLNHFLHGLNPMGYHLVNVVLHAVVSVLFTYVCQTVVFTQLVPAAIAGVLFATHPIHTEAVAGVVGRADLMACLFFLLSLLAFQRSIKPGKSGFAFTDRPGSLVLSLLLALCALLSKEHGATVLGVFIVYDVMMTSRMGIYRVLITRRFGRGCMPLFKRCAVIVAIVCVVLVLRVWVLQGHLPHFSEQDNPASFAPHLLTRVLTYSYLIFFNVWLLLCPWTLSYDWQMNSIPLVESVWDVRNLATIITVIAIGFLAVKCSTVTKDQDRRVLVLGLSFLAIPFLPASNLFIRVGFVVAERILYIPSMGLCILCGHALSMLGGLGTRHGKVAMMTAVAVITVLYVGKTVTRNQVWQSRESLFRSGLETLPHNAKMHYNYANFLMDRGQKQDAIRHYQTSLRLWPDHASANNNLGTLLEDDPERAESHYRRAILINPAHVRAHFNLASHLSKRGRLEDAEALFRRAIQLNPEFADVHTNLASLLEGKGQLLEAEQLYLNAVTLEPRNGDYCNNYGAFLTNTGRFEDARVQYEECLRMQPNHTVTMGNQARLLRRLGQTSQAEQLFLRALSLERRAGLLESLGALYFNTDRPEKAHNAYREAVQLNPQSAETRTHYAQVLATLGPVEPAIQELRVALNLDGDFAEAHRQLSSIYVQAGKHREGMKHATIALQLEPNADDARKAGLLFDIGNCLKELSRDQEAIQSYREAVKLNPALSPAHLNLGAMLHLRGDFTRARRHYDEALKLDPENHTLRQNLAKLSRAEQRLKTRR